MYLPIILTTKFTNKSLLTKRLHILMHHYKFILFFYVTLDFGKTLSLLRALSLQDFVRFIMPKIFKKLFLDRTQQVFPGSFYLYCSDIITRWVTLRSMKLGVIPFAFLYNRLFINFDESDSFTMEIEKFFVTWPFLVKSYGGFFGFFLNRINC